MYHLQRSKKYILVYVIILLILGSFVVGLFIGRSEFIQKRLQKETKITGKYTDKTGEVDFQLFWDVWDLLEKKFINKPLDYEKMLYGAISGIVSSLDDPYTVFMDPGMSKKFVQEMGGIFEGIGAEIGVKNNKIIIIAPLASSPAEKAGLKPKDVILKIDDKETQGMSLVEAVYLIRGEKGTQVKLTIQREGSLEPKEITIRREIIEVKSVEYKILEDDIAYIEIRYFGDPTTLEFREAVTDILVKNAKGIILDVRNNAGGYLQTAVEVASEFIENEVVAYEEFTEGRRNEFRAKGNARLKDSPGVVLVNEGSASASEILASALKDYNKAVLCGKKTFGKGTVQELESLSSGSSIRISVARWLTPKGKNIDGEGLIPDVEVELTDEDYNAGRDPQLDKALELLREKIGISE